MLASASSSRLVPVRRNRHVEAPRRRHRRQRRRQLIDRPRQRPCQPEAAEAAECEREDRDPRQTGQAPRSSLPTRCASIDASARNVAGPTVFDVPHHPRFAGKIDDRRGPVGNRDHGGRDRWRRAAAASWPRHCCRSRSRCRHAPASFILARKRVVERGAELQAADGCIPQPRAAPP